MSLGVANTNHDSDLREELRAELERFATTALRTELRREFAALEHLIRCAVPVPSPPGTPLLTPQRDPPPSSPFVLPFNQAEAIDRYSYAAAPLQPRTIDTLPCISRGSGRHSTIGSKNAGLTASQADAPMGGISFTSDRGAADRHRRPKRTGGGFRSFTAQAELQFAQQAVAKEHKMKRGDSDTPPASDHGGPTKSMTAVSFSSVLKSVVPDNDSVMHLDTIVSQQPQSQDKSEEEPDDGDNMGMGTMMTTPSLMVESNSVRYRVTQLVETPTFDYFAGVAIVLNALLIGAQTQFAAANLDAPTSTLLEGFDWGFCVVFTLELILRIGVYKWQFICGPGRWWNLFDLLLVGMQIIEKILEETVFRNSTNGESLGRGGGFSAMRILRLLRVVRIVRLVRVLRLIGELRTIVICIIGSLQSLMWTVVLLLLMIYISGVYTTHVVTDHRAVHRSGTNIEPLEAYYGSLFRSILTLYQAMSGGVSWNDCVQPLMAEIHPLLGVLFSLYVAFCLLAIMNVVTGVFVESALQHAKKDQDVYMVHSVHEAVQQADLNKDGQITWEEFSLLLKSPQMQETFKTIDISIDDADNLFRLLDVEDSGEVSMEDFVDACVKIRGPAKSIDLITFMSETRKTHRMWSVHLMNIERLLSNLELNANDAGRLAVSQ